MNTKKENHTLQETNNFALLQFDKPLTLLQQKLYYLSAALIKNGEDPNIDTVYYININDMAKITNTTPYTLKVNMKRVVDDIRTSSFGLQPIFKTEDKKIAHIISVYQTVFEDPDNPYLIGVRFNFDFRKKILEMKKIHDIEYPVKTIMELHSKYAIPLYVYLIAKVSVIRDQEGDTEGNGRFHIRVPKDELQQVLKYDSTPKTFHSRALYPACENINKVSSELFIEGDRPEAIKQGKAIVEYIFHVRVTTTISKPIFSKSLFPLDEFGIPGWDYITDKARGMGADKSFIATMKLSQDRARAWRSILYTLLRNGKSARYLNKAFQEDYGKKYDIRLLVRVLVSTCPEHVDDYIRQLDYEYGKNGVPDNPGFIEELLKHIGRRKTREKDPC